MEKLFRKAALITGASRRIGKEIALTLAKNQFDIAIHYNSSQKEAKELCERIKEEYKVNCEVFHSNLNFNSYENLIDNVYSKFPNLEILINNASIFEETPFLSTSIHDFDDHFNINLKAPFFLSQNFAKIVKKGSIINLLDSKITKTSKNYFSYLLTKKALEDFTKMAAKEVGPDIKVNAIAPGMLEISLGMDDVDYKNKIINSLPLKKLIETSQISNLVIFLIKNEYLTGQIIFTDSGENL